MGVFSNAEIMRQKQKKFEEKNGGGQTEEKPEKTKEYNYEEEDYN